MEIKASDVAKLRQMTGSGMMDCKNALVEAKGNFDRAQEIIREKGKLVAAKRVDRETKEGAVIAKLSPDGKKGIVVCLGCETDFVSQNAEFQALANTIADTALAAMPSSLSALLAAKAGAFTIEDLVSQQTGKTGEKHQIAYYDKLEAPMLVAYNHMNGKVSAMVAFNKTFDADAAKNVAMQTAAMKPVSVSKDDCPADVRQKELQIGREQAKLEGKPEAMLDKIAEGKLNRFFKDSTLLAQDFIKDSKLTVEAYIKSVDKDATVTAFKRFSLND